MSKAPRPADEVVFEAATNNEQAAFDALNEREKMVKGLAYLALEDRVLTLDRLKARTLCQQYNTHPFIDPSKLDSIGDFYGPDSRLQHLADLFEVSLEKVKTIGIEPPFYCDYGYNIEFKGGFYSNFGMVLLDCAKITFGKDVLCGPGVHIYTATHSVHIDERTAGYERAYPVEIGNDVWIGGGVKILGPTKIGNNCTIASGAVVKGDFPDNCIIGGVPARILKYLPVHGGPIAPNDKRLMTLLPGSDKSEALNDTKIAERK
ncbi:trimeric LpxA-like protein [Meredithblackwellia eburnea MCA 4105]